MKGHVEAVCPSQFSGELDEIPPAIEVENPVTFTLVAVFLDDLQRHVQQADGRGRVSVFWRRMCIQYVPSSDCVMSFSDKRFRSA